ncbi:MAG: 1,4-dihydroxy-6-naphthoate synthase [Proteobacteria bacterium]|nr:1,4-dihydroxy-6-naphthoate synthase [Pseudomonadota bacterium]
MSNAIELDIGFSPCPNDTFIFDALIHQRIDTAPFRFRPQIADVEELNKRGFAQKHPITKLSFYAYLLLKDHYDLLDSGAALGYGCGPLLVARKIRGQGIGEYNPISPEIGIVSPDWIRDARIAVPGRYTTAYLLLQIWQGKRGRAEFVRFDEILPGVASGKYDAGLVIHEGRFVYQKYNCLKIVDLGQWWESETGLPLPLGCIALRRDMFRYKEAVETLLRQSVHQAMKNPGAANEFIKLHAQELDDQVISDHISLFVNEFTLSLGQTGMRAIEALEERARCQGIL